MRGGVHRPTEGAAMARYKLVVFDFDGTLADSGPWFMRVLNQVAERHRFRKVSNA
jgi:phosphoglycolate phosphatase